MAKSSCLGHGYHLQESDPTRRTAPVYDKSTAADDNDVSVQDIEARNL